MEYVTHNEDDLINANGTHLLGTITMPCFEIEAALGKPQTGDFDKVQAEWLIQFEDGQVATIYDWKENKPYWDVTEWHIGGNNAEIVERVLSILKGE